MNYATKDPQVERVVTADYSQIELRVLAHLSQDPLLVDSFRSGEDVHTRTAIEMSSFGRGTLVSVIRVVCPRVASLA
jgi:DNA polymerase-1